VIPIGGDPWRISISNNPEIDFTVWVLRRDGLRTADFDSHADRDASLRAAGLTQTNWLAWFEHVVRSASERADAVSMPTEVNRPRESRPVPTAADMFVGPDAIRHVLESLWPGFILRYWEMRERDFDREVARLSALTDDQADRLARRQWDDLQRYRPLPPLHVYLVEYVKPVVAVCPPASMVVGLVDPREGDLDGHWAMVLEGARRLKEEL